MTSKQEHLQIEIQIPNLSSNSSSKQLLKLSSDSLLKWDQICPVALRLSCALFMKMPLDMHLLEPHWEWENIER